MQSQLGKLRKKISRAGLISQASNNPHSQADLSDKQVIQRLLEEKIPFEDLSRESLRNLIHSGLGKEDVRNAYLKLIKNRPENSPEIYQQIMQSLTNQAQNTIERRSKPAQDLLMRLASSGDSYALNILAKLLREVKIDITTLHEFTHHNPAFLTTYITLLTESQDYSQTLPKLNALFDWIKEDSSLTSDAIDWLVSEPFRKFYLSAENVNNFCEQFKLFDEAVQEKIWGKMVAHDAKVFDPFLYALLDLKREDVLHESLPYYRNKLLTLKDRPMPHCGIYNPIVLEVCATESEIQSEIQDPIAGDLLKKCLTVENYPLKLDFKQAVNHVRSFLKSDYYQQTLKNTLFAKLEACSRKYATDQGSLYCAAGEFKATAFDRLKTGMHVAIKNTVIEQIKQTSDLTQMNEAVKKSLIDMLRRHEQANCFEYNNPRNPVAFYCKWAIGVLACIPTVGLPLLSQTYRNRMFKTCSQVKFEHIKHSLETSNTLPTPAA